MIALPAWREEGMAVKNCVSVMKCSPSRYVNCPAYQQKKNCFEVEWTPCCSKNRQLCVSCPTYIAIMEVEKTKKNAIVYTSLHRLEGELHIPTGLRLIDALNATDKPFLAMTNVKIFSHDGSEPIKTVPFLIVSKSDIKTVISD